MSKQYKLEVSITSDTGVVEFKANLTSLPEEFVNQIMDVVLKAATATSTTPT